MIGQSNKSRAQSNHWVHFYFKFQRWIIWDECEREMHFVEVSSIILQFCSEMIIEIKLRNYNLVWSARNRISCQNNVSGLICVWQCHFAWEILFAGILNVSMELYPMANASFYNPQLSLLLCPCERWCTAAHIYNSESSSKPFIKWEKRCGLPEYKTMGWNTVSSMQGIRDVLGLI